MFDLEKEVTAWSRAVHADRCRNADEVAELADHLLSEIEQLQISRSRAGRSPFTDQQAFRIAVANLGGKREITAEHAKNRSRIGSLWAKVVRYERAQSAGNTRQHGQLLTAHAIFWAVLCGATSIALSKSGAKDAGKWLLTGVWIPLWFASEMVLRRVLRSRTGA